ncbi:MAG: hypothetical protein CBD69_005875 [Crocinitomicaceae bacterium TMED209]|nr:MAG: hypothetical protein CBD69_005875 [Crocinitomicaceae bacterium TMED209]|tara:strand:+ start:173 stop:628 length:456 start_codon:yes stop_codon:yes gene_type:complete
MKSFYKVIDSIQAVVGAEPFNNTVTFGDISEIDLKKQSMFPLAHVMVNNMNIEQQHVSFNVTLFLMDLVDISKEPDTTLFLGNDNTQDVLNTQAALATRVIRILQKSNLYKQDFEILGTANCEPFHERFDNNLCGWAVTFDVSAKDEMTYC